MSVICIDISHYQKGINLSSFHAGGGLGVILKASEGTTIKDDCYSEFRQQAFDAGLALASYHFFRPSDPVEQARWYLGCAEPVDGERVVCDFEDDKTTVDDMVAFLMEIQRINPSLQLTVYSGHLIKERLGNNHHQWLAANTSLWLAQYTTGAVSWPQGTWKQWSLHQYTDTGSVPGYSGNIDCDRFNGSDKNFLKWMGPTLETEAPFVILTVPSGTLVDVNGERFKAS